MNNVSLIDGHIDEPKQTNFDRIKAMSVEEMADIIFDIYKQGFFDAVHSDDVTEREEIIQWLLQEVSEDE